MTQMDTGCAYLYMHFGRGGVVGCTPPPHACMACEILVPGPGIEPIPPAVEAQSPNHWTAREFLGVLICVISNNSKQSTSDTGGNFLCFFVSNLFYLFTFGCWVFVAAHRLSLVAVRAGATLHCSVRASHCCAVSCCRARALGAQASVVVARELSSCGSWA